MTAKKLLGDSKVAALMNVLNLQGDDARIVGGAVRNALFDEDIGDVDFATKLPPQRVTELCEAAGYRVVPTGVDYGTVTVVVEKKPFEVTTLREDIETDGRHAVVKFGTSWEADAARRDFTINALYLDAGGKVHAPIGGLDDIKARRVRFIGDARQRLREDYLRIWRFFRFSAHYAQNDFDEKGLNACLQEKQGLTLLSAERVKQELFKLLVARRAAEAMELMRDMGLTVETLGVQRIARFKKLGKSNTPPSEAHVLQYLAALCVWTENDVERLALKLKLSRAETKLLSGIAAIGMKLRVKPDEKQARVLLHLFPEAYELAAGIAAAGEEEEWKTLLDLPQRRPVPVFPVKGADLLAIGHDAGPQLGEILKRLEQAWIDSDFLLTQQDLLKKAKV